MPYITLLNISWITKRLEEYGAFDDSPVVGPLIKVFRTSSISRLTGPIGSPRKIPKHQRDHTKYNALVPNVNRKFSGDDGFKSNGYKTKVRSFT